MPWDEHAAFPNLADFECSGCGQIGAHTVECSYHPDNFVIEEVPMTTKVSKPAPMPPSHDGRERDLPDDLLERVREAAKPKSAK